MFSITKKVIGNHHQFVLILVKVMYVERIGTLITVVEVDNKNLVVVKFSNLHNPFYSLNFFFDYQAKSCYVSYANYMIT